MHRVRARIGPLLHHKSVVARKQPKADYASQEPSAQSLSSPRRARVIGRRAAHRREPPMRLALRGLAAVAAALAAGVLSGSAQESFFNERFCTRSTSGNEDAGP